MITLQPIMITADGDEVDGKQHYRVRFQTSDGGEVDHVFVHDSNDIPGITWTREFWEATNGDPFVKKLTETIIRFHEARQK
jgi:hypothetical protein